MAFKKRRIEHIILRMMLTRAQKSANERELTLSARARSLKRGVSWWNFWQFIWWLFYYANLQFYSVRDIDAEHCAFALCAYQCVQTLFQACTNLWHASGQTGNIRFCS